MNELDIQKQVVAYAKKAHGLEPIVNVHNMIPWPKESKRRGQIANRMASLGFKPGQPDLIFLRHFFLPTGSREHTAQLFGLCAIELKTEKEDPFRKTKEGKYWIDNTGSIFGAKTSDKKEHVLKQAKYLADIVKDGGMGAFAAGFDQAKLILDACYMENKKGRPVCLEEYTFAYGWEAENKIYKFF